MKMFKEVILKGQNHGRRYSIDIRWTIDKRPKPVILFLHGFKGFKDWGTFPLIAEKLSDEGFVVVKMNFSHNGVTVDDPGNFNDLDAFAENRFSYELDDVKDTIDFICSSHFPVP
ncbi:MAG: dienelactone hydrolase, partial [Cyclobacteriaceae bacterium]